MRERDVAACKLAREYLLGFRKDGLTEEVLRHYLEPGLDRLRPKDLNAVYRRLLESAQNANMRSGVIGKSIGGVENLGKALCEFDPRAVEVRFSNGWEEVLDVIERDVRPRGKIRRTPRSIWPLFCRTVLSGAAFLAQFNDAQDFYQWVGTLDADNRTRPALPMLLSYEIDGLGFPLACDFLKELGYFNFGKPDIHVKTILSGLHLTPPSPDDYQTFKAITRIASSVAASPYYVDKLFWLVGSGYLYDHPTIGAKGRLPTDRAGFITKADRALAKECPV